MRGTYFNCGNTVNSGRGFYGRCLRVGAILVRLRIYNRIINIFIILLSKMLLSLATINFFILRALNSDGNINARVYVLHKPHTSFRNMSVRKKYILPNAN